LQSQNRNSHVHVKGFTAKRMCFLFKTQDLLKPFIVSDQTVLIMLSQFIDWYNTDCRLLALLSNIKNRGLTSKSIINQTVKTWCITKAIYAHLLHHFKIHGKFVSLTVAPITLEAHE
jgi:hypothetical protein